MLTVVDDENGVKAVDFFVGDAEEDDEGRSLNDPLLLPLPPPSVMHPSSVLEIVNGLRLAGFLWLRVPSSFLSFFLVLESTPKLKLKTIKNFKFKTSRNNSTFKQAKQVVYASLESFST